MQKLAIVQNKNKKNKNYLIYFLSLGFWNFPLCFLLKEYFLFILELEIYTYTYFFPE